MTTGRERLSKKFITFNKVNGKDFYNEFFNEDGKVKKEETIESIYNIQHMKSTSFGVEVTKEAGKIRGMTDGYVKCFINHKDSRIVNFYGIQECKRNIKRGTKAYFQQVKQSLLYAVQFKDIKFVLLPSVNYIDCIYLDENPSINKEELLSYLKDDCPSIACKNFTISDLKIHQIDMPTQAKIDEMWKNIYKHCIEI